MKPIFDSGTVQVIDDGNGGIRVITYDLEISVNLDVCVKVRKPGKKPNKLAISLRGTKGKLQIIPSHDITIEQILCMGPTFSLGLDISPAKPLKKNRWR